MPAHKTTRTKPSFWLAASRDQARDTGMALVLISLIVFLATKQQRYVTIGVLLLLVDMIARPFSSRRPDCGSAFPLSSAPSCPRSC